jgi:hypothetical protein
MKRLLATTAWVLTTAANLLPAAQEAEQRAPHLHRSDAEFLAVSNAEATATGIDWLLDNQNDDGTWGSHRSSRPIEVMCDVPGGHHAFRVATTALCVMALMETPRQSDTTRAAVSRGVDALLAQHEVKRPSLLEHYSVWAFGFGLQALADFRARYPDDPRGAEVEAVCRRLVEKLHHYQSLDGGWGYLSLQESKTYKPSFTSMSFTTATCLIGLERARGIGIELPGRMLTKALDSLQRCETGAEVYTYGELWRFSPHRSVNNIKGAACRTPGILEALRLFDRIDPEQEIRRYRLALDALLVDHPRFQIAGLRRPIPHESHYGVSGYFYLYGHYYAALMSERLEAADRDRYAPLLERAVLLCRQPDGSFWDYPLYSYHKPYGTAFALLALARTAPRD